MVRASHFLYDGAKCFSINVIFLSKKKKESTIICNNKHCTGVKDAHLTQQNCSHSLRPSTLGLVFACDTRNATQCEKQLFVPKPTLSAVGIKCTIQRFGSRVTSSCVQLSLLTETLTSLHLSCQCVSCPSAGFVRPDRRGQKPYIYKR